jgi:ferredoxin-NADP reductase
MCLRGHRRSDDMDKTPMQVRVHDVRYEADGVFSYEMRALDQTPLPAFTAGAHIDLALPNGLSRSYSLINRQDESDRYVIAVNKDERSCGGSKFICENIHPGAILDIAAPSNTFELMESAPLSVFIGGGIGITPLLCMIRRLEQLKRPWRLFYAARTRSRAAFLREFVGFDEAEPGRVTITFDHEPGNPMLNLASIVGEQLAGTHFYCCGPGGMLKAFEEATRSRAPEFVHVEYFSTDTPKAKGGFEVVLARSKKALWVKPDQTILATLLQNGVNVSRSCLEGVCGTCETVVLEGTPDHRDKVLSPRERASNKKMMICCSGSVGERLVLDI